MGLPGGENGHLPGQRYTITPSHPNYLHGDLFHGRRVNGPAWGENGHLPGQSCTINPSYPYPQKYPWPHGASANVPGVGPAKNSETAKW